MKFILADIEAVFARIHSIRTGDWIDFFGIGPEAALEFEAGRLVELLDLLMKG